MPVHDWSRVEGGIFHNLHLGWVVAISRALNDGILPPDFYSMAEPSSGGVSPEVNESEEILHGARSLVVEPPKVRTTATAGTDGYARKRRTLVIRHRDGDRIVALIEFVVPGNKASQHAFRSFVEKATDALARGYHLLLIDLQPPTVRDPQGIHGAVWAEFSDEPYTAPPDKTLTLAAYSAGRPETAYIEPTAVGDPLPEMPLFLDPWSYVNVPLEPTYRAAWRGVPRR